MHKCNKEVELQKMQDDIKYIKKSLAGNGEQGLMKTVRLLRETVENIQIVLVKLQSYNHLKNWILGSAITFLLTACGSLITYLFLRKI